MNARTRTLLDEARRLTRREQVELAEELFALIDITEDDPDAGLLPELDARWRAFERGEDPGSDAIEAIEDIRSKLKDRRS